MNAAVEIPQWRCHKVVRAAKITGFRGNGNADMPDLLLGEIGGVVSLLPDWHTKHQPKVGGYYVLYEDGYTSFSPAKAFEEGYTRTGWITGISDSQLLRNLAEDVPDMAQAIRSQLYAIADRLQKRADLPRERAQGDPA